MTDITRRRIVRAAPAALLLPGALARAQVPAFASKPIRYLVPVAAGGGSDFVGRTICERWGKVLGQTFVVENVGGGGGAIASQTTAKAPADGHTLMQAYVSTHGTSPATRTRIGYDPVKDFTPIGMIGGTPNVLVVNAGLPWQSLREFVEHARRHPGQVSYGSAGVGSLTQLVMELFKQQAGLFMVHVPYRGIAPAFTDLMGGQTQAMFAGLAAALPHIRSGRVRALAVTGGARHPTVKDVPTLVEAGYKGFDSLQWYGVAGPAGIAPETVRRLNDSLNAVLQQPDLRDKLATEALEPMPMSPDQFARYLQADLQRWTALAKARKIQLDE